MSERLIRAKEVLARVGIKSTSLWEWVKAGKFPKPIKLGDRAVAWIESEVNEWINNRIKERETDNAQH